MKKRRLIFNIASIIFLLTLIGIYTYRLIYYHNLENGYNSIETQTLSTYILTDSSLNNKLVNNGENYLYKGSNPNNYLRYSGLLWRIVKINKNNELVVVLNDTNVLLSYNNSYVNSSINKWLNKTDSANTGIFYHHLINTENVLVKNTLCLDKIENIDNITCETVNNDYDIGLLSLNDYVLAGGSSSYLNNRTNWWLSNTNAKGDKWYVTSNGTPKTVADLKNYGVRPVIAISSKVNYISGNGTIEQPYQLDNEREKVLSQKLIGEYVGYSNYTWKIVSQDDTGTKLVLADYLKNNNKDIVKTFSNNQNVYSLSNATLGNYLNNTFYKSLQNPEYIKKGTWNIGSYSLNDKYDYLTIYKSHLESYVGLLDINDMFVNDLPDIYTITGSIVADRTMHTINDNKELYGSLPTKELKIRPALYLDSTLFVVTGNGSKEKPYQVGR